MDLDDLDDMPAQPLLLKKKSSSVDYAKVMKRLEKEKNMEKEM
jgi:hypothetical protein